MRNSLGIAVDSVVSRLLQGLEIAVNIAESIRKASQLKAEGNGFAGALGIVGSVIPGFGFIKDALKLKKAGLLQIQEIVFLSLLTKDSLPGLITSRFPEDIIKIII